MYLERFQITDASPHNGPQTSGSKSSQECKSCWAGCGWKGLIIQPRCYALNMIALHIVHMLNLAFGRLDIVIFASPSYLYAKGIYHLKWYIVIYTPVYSSQNCTHHHAQWMILHLFVLRSNHTTNPPPNVMTVQPSNCCIICSLSTLKNCTIANYCGLFYSL